MAHQPQHQKERKVWSCEGDGSIGPNPQNCKNFEARLFDHYFKGIYFFWQNFLLFLAKPLSQVYAKVFISRVRLSIFIELIFHILYSFRAIF
jgi:hypothetical protein